MARESLLEKFQSSLQNEINQVKKTTFNEDLVDLQKVQLNAIKESEKRQQDFMEIIIKQQQEQESREREAHRKLLLKLGKMLFSSK